MEMVFMDPTTALGHGLRTPGEVPGDSGRKTLQAIIDGEPPRPPIAAAASFWIIVLAGTE
jgi:hypothetical protein